jgi:hypothetical protein
VPQVSLAPARHGPVAPRFRWIRGPWTQPRRGDTQGSPGSVGNHRTPTSEGWGWEGEYLAWQADIAADVRRLRGLREL